MSLPIAPNPLGSLTWAVHGTKPTQRSRANKSKDLVNPRRRGAVEFEVGPFETLPNEILTLVLSFVPGRWLRNCALVCNAWRDAISRRAFWKEKCRNTRRIRRFVDQFLSPYYPKDWREFYFKRLCTRNLIKNPSGEDGLDHGWIFENGSGNWRVETEDAGADKKPPRLLAISDGKPNHFATSKGSCRRHQVIDLLAVGFSPATLDREQPDVVISDWYAFSHSDDSSTFGFKVELLQQEHGNVMANFNFGPVDHPYGTPNKWQEVMTRFYGYGPGLRFIRFTEHTESDDAYDGPKMAGSVVKLEFRSRACDWDI